MLHRCQTFHRKTITVICLVRLQPEPQPYNMHPTLLPTFRNMFNWFRYILPHRKTAGSSGWARFTCRSPRLRHFLQQWRCNIREALKTSLHPVLFSIISFTSTVFYTYLFLTLHPSILHYKFLLRHLCSFTYSAIQIWLWVWLPLLWLLLLQLQLLISLLWSISASSKW